MRAKDLSFDKIKIGDRASFKKNITDKDIINFAQVSGDHNPLHTNTIYAGKTEFNGVIVHGMFLGALISRLVGMELPGRRALLLKESLEFRKPARLGDKLLIKGEVIHKSQAARLIELSVGISRGKDLLVSGSVHVRLIK